jgi:MFS transporter, MHS family, alpha-ketoglutarate permease
MNSSCETHAPRRAAAAGMTQLQRLRSIFGGSVGNLVEWYDWYVYAAFALYFSKAFFPQGDQTTQLLNSAAVFAVGFLVRPLGGLLMGWYADRHGRKKALTASVLLMCLGSLLIAVTPGYAAIGVYAPIMLIFARLLQGLSVGGEYGTSATYLSEIAAEKYRGFFASFQYVTLIMGQLAALLVLVILQQYVLTPQELESWGWRIPFFIGALLALSALYIRRSIDETPSFEHAGRRRDRGVIAGLLAHPRACLTVVGLTAGGTVAFYTYTTYIQKYLVNTLGWSKAAATSMSASTLIVFMLLQPLVGLLSDKVGRKPILIAFGIAGTLGTIPLMRALAAATSPSEVFVLLTMALLVVSGYTAINAVVKAELFPAEIRATGVGFPYAVAVSLFGGTAEYLALWLKSIGHETFYFYYVTALIAASLLVYASMPDTKKTSKIVEPAYEH